MAYIAKDRQTKLDQISQLSKSKDVVKEDLELLEVQAWVNDPETRWRAQRAIGEFAQSFFPGVLFESVDRMDEGDVRLVAQDGRRKNGLPFILLAMPREATIELPRSSRMRSRRTDDELHCSDCTVLNSAVQEYSVILSSSDSAPLQLSCIVFSS